MSTTGRGAAGVRTPLFVKEGAVIPMLTKAVANRRDACGHPLEIRHYGKTDGSFELYEDDGNSLDYENGEYSLRTFRFAGGKGGEIEDKPVQPLFGKVERWVEMTK